MESEILICECNSIEHQIVFSYFEDDDYSDVYATIYLKHYPFWQRVKNAVRYIFGHKSRIGDFEEFIFKKEDADKLQKVVNFLKSRKDE